MIIKIIILREREREREIVKTNIVKTIAIMNNRLISL